MVAEFGGRWPAVATALASALSLDFFLTQPYLHLAIDDKHDIIAFAGARRLRPDRRLARLVARTRTE